MASIRATTIKSIGARLVRCSQHCDGIVCNRKTGHIPRCLYLEPSKLTGTKLSHGAAVVGLNPGRSSMKERSYYRSQTGTYEAITSWFFENASQSAGRSHRYYKKLRGLLSELGLDGPILWTELVKCESDPRVKRLPLQTLRTCSGLFLKAELAAVPAPWPLFAIGREAYMALAYSFPNRAVIGIPHPTGSWGQYSRLARTKAAAHEMRKQIRRATHSCTAIWLADG